MSAPNISMEVWQLADLALNNRLIQAIDSGVSRYPIYRTQRFAVRTELEALFDAIALDGRWHAQRLDSTQMILDHADAFITAHGSRKQSYCSCHFSIWAKSVEAAQAMEKALLAHAGEARISEPMFSIDWHFLTGKGELESASIEEMADDVLHDLAYPEIKEGVHAFIERYLDAEETVLVLQGPPGTGKTRLIRAILGAMSRRNNNQAQALYTGDKKALEGDQIFVKFITGWEDAFVVEDADHILKPRAEGNEHLHRFLTIADGVVRSQGRKIIFSTNLPNVGDLDDALIRPGRCFGRIYVRELTLLEAKALARSLTKDASIAQAADERLEAMKQKSYSLATVYGEVKKGL